MKKLTHEKEFYLTGAYAQGVKIDGKLYLLVTQIEESTFSDGNSCDERILKEYGL